MDANPAPDTGLPITDDRALGWRLLYPFIEQRRFPLWNREEASIARVEERCPLEIRLFISHRWASGEDPDPEEEQLPTVVEYLTRVFMVANGFQRGFSRDQGACHRRRTSRRLP